MRVPMNGFQGGISYKHKKTKTWYQNSGDPKGGSYTCTTKSITERARTKSTVFSNSMPKIYKIDPNYWMFFFIRNLGKIHFNSLNILNIL